MTRAPSVRVARAAADEWPTVKAVRLRALGADPGAFGSTLARELAFEDEVWRERAAQGRTFLARRGGRVIGIVAYHREAGRELEPQLVGMWVEPDARGAGAGAALVQGVLDAVVHDGATRLSLDVAAGNDAARRLYERCGFEPAGQLEPLPGNPALVAERFSIDLR